LWAKFRNDLILQGENLYGFLGVYQ
jgi:hypothetical protein